MYSTEPQDPDLYKRKFDTFYSRFAGLYGLLVNIFPVWSRWTSAVLPHLVGPRVLEVSFGTGHLMLQIAKHLVPFGIDLNWEMAVQADARLKRNGFNPQLQVADVDRLPYTSGAFDSVVCTMAFSGFPDGQQALREMSRVLKPGGNLAMVDINYPADGNKLGTMLTDYWKSAGDLIRDVPAVFQQLGWNCTDKEVGGLGSVHLYLAEK